MEFNYEPSDCVTNAEHEFEKIHKKGRIVWIVEQNHAYVIPDDSDPDDFAINPKVRVHLGDETQDVQFEDFTRSELEDMLARGEAEDITNPGEK